jgi:dihydrofolate reductase
VGISLIAAVARNGIIGRGGGLPWRLPDDLAWFRSVTMGHPVLMGRRTWEAIGRPLPGRRNLVLSRDPSFRAPGAEVLRDPSEAFAVAAGAELFVIGGAAVFAAFLPSADRVYLTHVDADVPGDRSFPEVDWRQWHLVSERAAPADAANPLARRYAVYERG